MKPPNCKVCQKAHWTYDGHSVSETAVPEYVKEMAAGALGTTTQSYEPPIIVTRDETPVTKRNNVTDVVLGAGGANFRMKPKGRPKKYADAAARQRAYRSRK